jgi:hypothetical protein
MLRIRCYCCALPEVVKAQSDALIVPGQGGGAAGEQTEGRPQSSARCYYVRNLSGLNQTCTSPVHGNIHTCTGCWIRLRTPDLHSVHGRRGTTVHRTAHSSTPPWTGQNPAQHKRSRGNSEFSTPQG